jgi:hypothetical protein
MRVAGDFGFQSAVKSAKVEAKGGGFLGQRAQ